MSLPTGESWSTFNTAQNVTYGGNVYPEPPAARNEPTVAARMAGAASEAASTERRLAVAFLRTLAEGMSIRGGRIELEWAASKIEKGAHRG